MRQFNKSSLLYESVLDDVERSEEGRSSGIVASQYQSPKTDWSVYLTLCIGKEANRFEELLPISKQISDFLDSHPAVLEHSTPEIVASDLILSRFKFGCEVCFRSLRQYVKFFYGLLSLIEQIQGYMSKEDFIEVDSDSDPLDGTWKVRRRDAFERLLINAESFDFLDEDTEPILNNLEIYQNRCSDKCQRF